MCKAIAEKVIENLILCEGKALKTGETGAEEDRTTASNAEGGTEKEEGETAESRVPSADWGMEALMEGLPPPGLTTRRKILPHEIEAIRGGRSIEGTFIGRPSTWGNPFRIGRDGDRAEVVKKYSEYLNAS